MNHSIFHTCPWWLLPAFDNPLRKALHEPEGILAPYVRPGDTALDVGCGMGYFTLPLARLVQGAGDQADGRAAHGRVIAADLQPEMLAGLRRRAERAGLLNAIQFVQAAPDHIGVDCPLDFVLAFWMVHEVRRPDGFLEEIYGALKPSGRMLIVEPRVHVSARAFEKTVAMAQNQGLNVVDRPTVKFSRSVLLEKSSGRK